jgi:hypothetical protein
MLGLFKKNKKVVQLPRTVQDACCLTIIGTVITCEKLERGLRLKVAQSKTLVSGAIKPIYHEIRVSNMLAESVEAFLQPQVRVIIKGELYYSNSTYCFAHTIELI